jgi:two-component system chemotaxis response regulator CheB
VLIAQHKPQTFTQALAERLDSLGPYRVQQARHGDVIMGGHVYIAPGGKNMRLLHDSTRGHFLTAKPATAGDRYAPSVDVLFESVAQHWKGPAMALILTGMGTDGSRGVVSLRKRGVEIYAESEESAVIFGMPQVAWKTGAVKKLLPLEQLALKAGRFLSQTIESAK